MKRIYFLVPDLKTTRSISQELEHTGIQHKHIHVLGSTPDQLDKAHLHSASVLQTTGLLPTLKKGLLFGLLIALIIFGLLYWLLPPEISINALGIAAVFVFGTGFGIWASGMIGLSTKDPVLEKNKDYVSSGHFILIADIPVDREHELTAKVIRHHPGTKVASEPLLHGQH
jgi:hypothetical protein